MKGIILKDLYDNFRIGKNLASYIFGGGFIILFALLFSAGVSTQFSFGWLIMMTSTIFSSCTLESACEQDEKANFNRLLISFPLSKTQIVLSRYLLTLCCIGAANLLTLLLTLYTVFFPAFLFIENGVCTLGSGIGNQHPVLRNQHHMLLSSWEKERHHCLYDPVFHFSCCLQCFYSVITELRNHHHKLDLPADHQYSGFYRSLCIKLSDIQLDIQKEILIVSPFSVIFRYSAFSSERRFFMLRRLIASVDVL